MTLNRLKTYKWEQGSLNNPVTLTSDEFGWLIDLIKTERINKDIRGWIRPTRDVTSYEKYLVELAKDSSGQPLLHLVDVNVSAIEYNVTPSSNKVNEGDRVKINVNNIALDALKFRIVNHTVQTEEYQNRTSIDTKLGYVVVEPARENATWSDVVTIQACPVWEDWDGVNSSIRTFDITVNAQQVTDVTITAPDMVGPSLTFYPTINFVPSGHTKPIVHTLEEAALKKGICFIPRSEDFTVSKRDSKTIVAVAPVTETEVDSYYSISCDVYAFTNQSTMATPSVDIACKHPYIQIEVTTNGDISDILKKDPKITLQRIDSDGNAIGDSVVLSGTNAGSHITYYYGNGFVSASGLETYNIRYDVLDGYRKIEDMQINPKQVENKIQVLYKIAVPDLYIIYENGDLTPILEIIDNDYKFTRADAVGIYVEDDAGSFIIPGLLPYISTKDMRTFLDNDTEIQGCSSYINYTIASRDFNGDSNTDAILNAYSNHAEYNSDGFATRIFREQYITISGKKIYGHVASPGELLLVYANNSVIRNTLCKFFGNPAIILEGNFQTTVLFDDGPSSNRRYYNAIHVTLHTGSLNRYDRCADNISGGAIRHLCCMTYKA